MRSHLPHLSLLASVLVVSLCLGLTPQDPFTAAAAAQVTSWIPKHVVQQAFPGSVSTLEVVLRSEIDLNDLRFRVVPALAPYVHVLNAGGASLAAGEAMAVRLLLSIPADVPLGHVEGTIHVTSGSRGTLAPPLPLTLEVRAPGPSTQPVGPEGGMFGFPGGLVLAIPPGAVSTLVDITVTPLSCADVDAVLAAQVVSSHQRRCVGGFVGAPTGLVFANPVTA